uniref:Uncharacterized protein n=1 Tax=Rhizophora mucronata TaxID=61149 RepID=A0A2P2PPV4_RHIMU
MFLIPFKIRKNKKNTGIYMMSLYMKFEQHNARKYRFRI